MKRCYRCGLSLEADQFYKDRHTPDGLMNRCKSCEREYRRESRARNSETIRAIKQREYSRNKTKYASRWQEWHENNRHKQYAHNKVKDALKAGELKKQPCKECGKTDVDAHHPNYDKPLEVIWLCRTHHMRLHSK